MYSYELNSYKNGFCCIHKPLKLDTNFKFNDIIENGVESLVVNTQPIDEIFVDFELIIFDVVECDCIGRTAIHVL
jgi:hypothetical protein